MATIHDTIHIDELKAYTFNLIQFLNNNQYLTDSGLEDIITNHFDQCGQFVKNKIKCSYVSKRGRITAKCQCVVASNDYQFCEKHSQTVKKELEYFKHNGSEYYLFASDNSVYTYTQEPIKIGIYDDATDAILAF